MPSRSGQLRRSWRWCRLHPKTAGAVSVVVVILIVIGSLSDAPDRAVGRAKHTSGPSTSPLAAASSATPASDRGALGLLATLDVKGRAPKSGYSRDQFGPAWTDDNRDPLGRNGCDTRNDILARDLHSQHTVNCAVVRGVLLDPYTATTIRFVRGVQTSQQVQIDHVVALSDAWQTGAQRWAAATRTDFANDPLNLLAVDGPANEAKGDGDAATWLPPNKAYRCAYVARQVAVKARYRLWVTPAEHDAIAGILGTCPGQRVPTEAGQADVGYRSKPTSRAQPATHVYYANCTAVRAAGAAPLRRGEPGYRAELDRDGDGVACEI
jgi:hypothetical protein